jgi:hypothetical protein
MGILDRLTGNDPERRARLERAGAAVDRELAANLELSAMFDSSQQAAVFENGEFARFASALRLDLPPDPYAALATVYEAIPAIESAMERRGPANTIRPEDRALIEAWEGDVRHAQRGLRDAMTAPPPPVWASLIARLRGWRTTRR